MAVDLVKRDRPARSRPPTMQEFWVSFALWLLNQFFHSKRGANLPLEEMPPVKAGLKSTMTKDRLEVLESLELSSEAEMENSDHLGS